MIHIDNIVWNGKTYMVSFVHKPQPHSTITLKDCKPLAEMGLLSGSVVAKMMHKLHGAGFPDNDSTFLDEHVGAILRTPEKLEGDNSKK